MDNKSVFFTIVACNYLGQSLTLGKSLKKYHPEIEFCVFLMDDTERIYSKDLLEQGFTVVHPEDISIENYSSFVFKYNVVEASTAVKPSVATHLFEKGFNKVVYIDPDMFCYRKLEDLFNLLDEYSIVLTPHMLTPASDDYLMNDMSFLKVGSYNLGFVAMSKSESSTSFLQWWSNRLNSFCVEAVDELSLFVDQKWVDLVPSFFDRVLILKDPGYNIAYWNVRERELILTNGELQVKHNNKISPVALIHFSSFDINCPDKISKYQRTTLKFNNSITAPQKFFSFNDRPDLVEAWNDYRDSLIASKYNDYIVSKYTFNYYDNGETISSLERILYLSSPDMQSKFPLPFSVGVNSFHQTCRNSGIKEFAKSTPIKKISISENEHSLQGSYSKISRVIYPIMKLIVLIIGTQRYILFTKFMSKQLSLYNHSFLLK